MSKYEIEVGDLATIVGPEMENGWFQSATMVITSMAAAAVFFVEDAKTPDDTFIKVGTIIDTSVGEFVSLDTLFEDCEILTIEDTKCEIWWEYVPEKGRYNV